MGLEIRYKSEPAGAKLKSLFMTLDGNSVEIGWSRNAVHSEADNVIQMNIYIMYRLDNNKIIAPEDLKDIMITNATWTDNKGNECGGSITILAAQFFNFVNMPKIQGIPLTLPYEIIYGKIDPGVRDIVQYFNEHGLHTVMSSDGTDNHSFGFLWVAFHSSVTESDIRAFMERHTKDWACYDGHGWFCNKFMLEKSFGNTHNQSMLAYIAASPAVAKKDIKQWKINDERMKQTCGMQ